MNIRCPDPKPVRRAVCARLFAGLLSICGLVCSLAVGPVSAADKAKPNVVIVITDDQGYGDLSCHGNPTLKTPRIDELYAQSISLGDYHVAPTCSPTRCAFLTGHWTNRTGVWHTIMGRSMLRENETTMGKLFQDAGYATGMFGKWHLGDNYPYRPEDRGFSEVMRHGGGGVGQTPDYWDNAYFDGSYWHNGTPEKVKGFCTDVFFDYAKRFIQDQKSADQPFLAYIATNAPHGPMHSPEADSEPYQDQGVSVANFYGMIANIDRNVGKMREFLREEGLEENTIFIFTTDNGSSSGFRNFNANMRGNKGSPYDGGHRVPFMLHWPEGGFDTARTVEPITAHVDVVPTLLDLCGIEQPADIKFDGRSIMPLLTEANEEWPDRILVTDSQRVKDPIKWRQSSVMTDRWRLINGKELYDIKADPSQASDVASGNPETVERLRAFYDAWWAELEPTFANETPIYLGHPKDNPARLTSHDWITTGSTPWNQAHIRKAIHRKSETGFWNVKVHQAGRYKVRLRRWPEESGFAIDKAIPAGDPVPGAKAYRNQAGEAVKAVKATLRIGDQRATKLVSPGDVEATIELDLPAGRSRMAARFIAEDGTEYGAYYAYVELVK